MRAQPADHIVTLRVSEETAGMLKAMAAVQNMAPSELCRVLIEDALMGRYRHVELLATTLAENARSVKPRQDAQSISRKLGQNVLD